MSWWLLGLTAAVLGIAPAYVAERKGRDWFGWWLWGALAFPVALVMALVADPTERAPQGHAPLWQRCPFCLEFKRGGAAVCSHCGRDVPLDGSPQGGVLGV